MVLAIGVPLAWVVWFRLEGLGHAPWLGLGGLTAGLLVLALLLLRRIAQGLFTEQALHRECESLRAQTQAAVDAKSRFLRAAGHDLRQPLHGLALFTANLRHQFEEPQLQVPLAQMAQMLQSMSTLITALQESARIDAGVPAVQLQAVALGPLLQRLALDFATQAQAKGLQWRLRVQSITVDTDPVLLERMLRNLLSNAVRHTRQGGILLAAQRRGEAVLISVWDTGPGIESKDHLAIFEEFVQLDQDERDGPPGLGLGLATVQQLSGRLKHAVNLRSQVSRGSCFSVLVPVASGPVGS